MKTKLSTILVFVIIPIALIITSCTSKYDAHLRVQCPCTVDKIEVTKDSPYRVRFSSVLHKDNSFWFYTNNEYKINDTIQ